MKTAPVSAFVLCLVLPTITSCAVGQSKPPVAEIRPVTDNYFGTNISDPYRYMENTKDPEVQAWMKAQNDYTRATLDAIPGRAALLADIMKYIESAAARVSSYSVRGQRYFYIKRKSGENVGKLYVRDSLEAPERLLLDPMAGIAAGTHATVDGYVPSWDGKWIAVGIAAGGSEDTQLRILEVATGKQVGDPIPRNRFLDVNWLPDNSGFLYNQLQEMKPGMPVIETEQRSRIFLHRLHGAAGTDQAIFGNGVSAEVQVDPVLICQSLTDPDSHYVVAWATTGVSDRASTYVASLAEVSAQPAGHIHWTKFADLSDPLGSIVLRRDVLYFATAAGAPNFRVMQAPAAHPDLKSATTVIPEQAGSVGASIPGDGLFAAQDALYVPYLENGLGKMMRAPYGGTAQPIPLPYSGTILTAAVDPGSPGVLVEMTTWTRYGDIFAYSPATGTTTSTGLTPQGIYDNPTGLVAEEVEVTAKDGVMVPLSIVHLKNAALDGKHPTLLYGYGAYGSSTLPIFGPVFLPWFERGGIMAFAHVRGGGERGEAWHVAGQKANKPNTWNDAIACAEYLVAKKYAAPATLGIEGGSAGGIFVGRSITERPDLFAAAIDQVPLSDTLRAELTPNGVPNTAEFGSAKTEAGFKALYAMSAYHHVVPGTHYPAVLVTTGINDPRVDPSQPAKLTAMLQASSAGPGPVLLRVDYDAGHGMGSTLKQNAELLADTMSFALWQFGDPGFQPRASSDTATSGQRRTWPVD